MSVGVTFVELLLLVERENEPSKSRFLEIMLARPSFSESLLREFRCDEEEVEEELFFRDKLGVVAVELFILGLDGEGLLPMDVGDFFIRGTAALILREGVVARIDPPDGSAFDPLPPLSPSRPLNTPLETLVRLGEGGCTGPSLGVLVVLPLP